MAICQGRTFLVRWPGAKYSNSKQIRAQASSDPQVQVYFVMELTSTTRFHENRKPLPTPGTISFSHLGFSSSTRVAACEGTNEYCSRQPRQEQRLRAALENSSAHNRRGNHGRTVRHTFLVDPLPPVVVHKSAFCHPGPEG